jgi:hypothetical protein
MAPCWPYIYIVKCIGIAFSFGMHSYFKVKYNCILQYVVYFLITVGIAVSTSFRLLFLGLSKLRIVINGPNTAESNHAEMAKTIQFNLTPNSHHKLPNFSGNCQLLCGLQFCYYVSYGVVSLVWSVWGGQPGVACCMGNISL